MTIGELKWWKDILKLKKSQVSVFWGRGFLGLDFEDPGPESLI